MKQCSQCHAAFPATQDHFYRQADRLTSACVSCSKLIQKQKRIANPERYRAYDRTRYTKDPEKHRASARKDYYTHTAQRRATARQWMASHREHMNRKAREHYRAHPEQSALSRIIRKTRRRAAQASAAINDLTRQQWKQVKEHYHYRCAYCGKKPKRLEMDHITPLSKGGNHTMSNVIPACRSCNAKKGTGPVLCPVQPVLLL